MRWLHIQWSTFGAWRPGDPRGFRNDRHRIHSSGDYKNPPPAGEHAGLLRYARRVMHREPVALEERLRERARDSIVDKAGRVGLDVACLAVARAHVHLLARFQARKAAVVRVVGQLKRHSSHALREAIPGKLWGAGCHIVAVKDRAHQVTAFNYIVRHAVSEGAAVWDRRTAQRG